MMINGSVCKKHIFESPMLTFLNSNTTTPLETFRTKAETAPYALVPGQSLPSSGGTSTSAPTTTPTNSATPSTSTTAPPSAESHSNNSLSTGAIVGIVMGILGFFILAALAIYLIAHRNKSHQTMMAEVTRMSAGGLSQFPNQSPALNTFNSQPNGPYNNQSTGPIRETVILPMTEAEKAMYMGRLQMVSPGPMSPPLPTSPQPGQLLRHDTSYSNAPVSAIDNQHYQHPGPEYQQQSPDYHHPGPEWHGPPVEM